MRWVSTSVDPNDKIEIYEELRATNREGVVFKDMDAPYSPGRPNSGGPQLKFKFVESASFVVTGINAKRSVTLGLYQPSTAFPIYRLLSPNLLSNSRQARSHDTPHSAAGATKAAMEHPPMLRGGNFPNSK